MNRRTPRVLTAAVVALLVASVITVVSAPPERKRLSADFPSTISLYAGAKVKVLGVDVGEVTDIRVRGTKVRVEMSYDADRKLPAEVHAVIVPPSIVGDRFVQLTPVYRSGPVLADDARVGLDRTAVPVELDDTYRSNDELIRALGPKGANANGALSDLVGASADYLRGNGARYNRTIKDLAAAVETLSGSREDIAGTVRNFGKLSKRFATDDGTIRSLSSNLAAVSTALSEQRAGIASATKNLSGALKDLERFVAANKKDLTANITGLARTSQTLARHTDDLGELLDIGPLGLTNFLNIYQPLNWDPEHPERSDPDGRTGVLAMRTPSLADLDLQLGHAMTAVCGRLPDAERARLEPLCTALRESGGELGAVVRGLAQPESGSANSLAGLLAGGR